MLVVVVLNAGYCDNCEAIVLTVLGQPEFEQQP